jgi:hypothetical protein
MMHEVGCGSGQHGSHVGTYMHSWWNWSGSTVMELRCHCWRIKMTEFQTIVKYCPSTIVMFMS